MKAFKYPKVEVGKYLYTIIEGQYRKDIQYVGIELSVAHNVTWGDCYTTL